MSSVTRFVGLDYHQDSVQVCVMDQQGQVLVNRSVENLWPAITEVLGETIDDESGPVSVRAAIESCSGAAHLAEELIELTGWSVTLGHPGPVSHAKRVNRMKQNPDKSDKADAWILADLIRLGYLPKVWLAPEEIRQLRSLVRFRAQKVKQRTRVKLRLRSILREHRIKSPQGINAWTQAWLRWLQTIELDETTTFLRDEYVVTACDTQSH